MSANTDAEAPADRLLASARRLYQNLHAELSKALPLPLPPLDESDAATRRAETVRAHRKALQTVLDIEMRIAREAGRTGLGNDIDLDAARTEIYGRLGRLAAAG